MNSILLSIIIPVYNVEDYLRECLDSIVSQDLTDCEIICINDGSTDNCANILLEYENNYFEKIRIIHQENMGLSEARNRGVSESYGEWLYFIDSDDICKPFAISTIKELITSYPNVGMIKMDNLQTDGGKRLTIHPKDLPLMTYSEFFEKCFTIHKIPKMVSSVSPCTYIIRRTEWENNHFSFDKGLRYEDAMFLYRLAVKKGTIQIVHIEEPFYAVRQNRVGSISTDVSMQHYVDRLFIIEESIMLFKEKGIRSSFWFEPLLSYFHWLIIEATENEMVEEFSRLASHELIQKLKIGICNKESRKKWILAMIGVKTSSLYYANTINGLERRLINRFFTMLDTHFPKWLIKE